jgi:hypothetical protein
VEQLYSVLLQNYSRSTKAWKLSVNETFYKATAYAKLLDVAWEELQPFCRPLERAEFERLFRIFLAADDFDADLIDVNEAMVTSSTGGLSLLRRESKARPTRFHVFKERLSAFRLAMASIMKDHFMHNHPSTSVYYAVTRQYSFSAAQRMTCLFVMLVSKLFVSAFWLQSGDITVATLAIATLASTIMALPIYAFPVWLFQKNAAQKLKSRTLTERDSAFVRGNTILLYALCWITILMCSFLSVLYSLKFDSQTANGWLIVWGMSMTLNLVVVSPSRAAILGAMRVNDELEKAAERERDARKRRHQERKALKQLMQGATVGRRDSTYKSQARERSVLRKNDDSESVTTSTFDTTSTYTESVGGDGGAGTGVRDAAMKAVPVMGTPVDSTR